MVSFAFFLVGLGSVLGLLIVLLVSERSNGKVSWWTLARFRCAHVVSRASLSWLDASRTHELVSGLMHKLGGDWDAQVCDACLLGSSTIARLGDFHDGGGYGEGPPDAAGRLMNLGIEGLQTKHMLSDEFQHAWATRVPHLKVALVYVGINDAMFDPDPDDLAERIVRVLRLVQTRAQHVLYLPILESNFQHWGGEGRLAYVRDVDRLVRERCARTEDGRLAIVTPPALDPCDFGWDGVHLHTQGSMKLKERVREWCSRRIL